MPVAPSNQRYTPRKGPLASVAVGAGIGAIFGNGRTISAVATDILLRTLIVQSESFNADRRHCIE